MKKMSKKEFWIRFATFSVFACILPFVFIAWRYKIFRQIDKMSLTGWGIIGMIIVAVFVFYLLKMVKKGLPYSMLTQIINGVAKVILPLALLYAMLSSIKTNINMFLQCLLVVIMCEVIAIPVNPLPKWLHDEKTNNLAESLGALLKKEDKQ